jgi:DNA-binding response OmpR family regulator
MMTLELEAANLYELLSSSLSIVKEVAQTQRVRLDLNMDEEFGDLQLDQRKTKQIVYNLLSNAVKFSGHDGVVTLSARRVPRSAVGVVPGGWPLQSFSLAKSEFDEFVELMIMDTGIGISKLNMSKLFQAFSQIDSSLSRKFEGTGLGLAMVKQLAEIHGGTVAVASAEGQGSCFAVWLPIRGEFDVSVEIPVVVEPQSAVPEVTLGTALVVEDNEHASDLIRLLLEAEGFKVIVAADAEEALKIAPRQSLSLITIDVELPGIDGWEFLLRIREINALANVPVVIIASKIDTSMALASGAAAVLQKPISRTELNASLTRLGLNPNEFVTRRVLVIDDDLKAVELIATLLPMSEYTVVRAYGGAEGISLAQRLLPDVVILDLMMPDVSGFDVAEALQRNRLTANIPIIVVTAKSVTSTDRDQLMNASSMVLEIVEKGSIDRLNFVDGVRRALRQPLAVL